VWLIMIWKEAEFSSLRMSQNLRDETVCLRITAEERVHFCGLFSCWINFVTDELPVGVLTSTVLCSVTCHIWICMKGTLLLRGAYRTNILFRGG